MRLPLTLHPANHLGVQCLLLHAALSSDSVNGVAGSYSQQKQYNTAASIARLRTRYNWEGRYGPCGVVRLSHCWRGVLWPPSAAVAAFATGSNAAQSTGVELAAVGPIDRVGAPSSLVPPSPVLNTTQTQQADVYRTLAFTAPARLIALYAPPVLLRALRKSIHDIVSYDAAVHHAALLTKLLAPYGVHVALTGATRRGCPFAFQAEFLLCLTEAAECEVEALAPDGAGGVVKDGRGEAEHLQNNFDSSSSASGASVANTAGTATTALLAPAARCFKTRAKRAKRQRRCVGSAIMRDGLMLDPQTSLPAAALNATGPDDGGAAAASSGGTRHHHQQRVRGSLGASMRRRYCSRCEAFSSADSVSPPVWYRIRRALENLIRCGYVVSAAESFPPSKSKLEARRAICLTARYDPHRPTQVPPPACTDPAILCRLQLHRLVLRFCAWHAFAARQLFLTGPAAFTTHATLQALEGGLDLNMNGVFTLARTDMTSRDSGGSDTTPDTAAAVGKVHDDPSRPEYQAKQMQPQEQGRCDLVEQLILPDEEDVVSLAGLPHVDPMLRGLYCQRNHL
ncbi:hypothetical protein GH5_08505 [Leishmania sp. Ghana 2012 LV757]|uniref:hypothetical protein n=1 Tax=Leishmania sp. Ghana 2012 LV757 TaxID=2803181 RepID=UPI001B634666|nr:hypothetical protein GH5_08505 [Leishmania sp. Ghana 2012 LV757]